MHSFGMLQWLHKLQLFYCRLVLLARGQGAQDLKETQEKLQSQGQDQGQDREEVTDRGEY